MDGLGPVRCGGWPQGSGAETSCRELFLQRDQAVCSVKAQPFQLGAVLNLLGAPGSSGKGHPCTKRMGSEAAPCMGNPPLGASHSSPAAGKDRKR